MAEPSPPAAHSGRTHSRHSIATKSEVHRLLIELADQGVAVLMISSELPEVLRVADRILVMREGRLVAEMSHNDASEESIVAAATGQLERAVA
jgi:rhamnose transport system ATP-binding protein